MAGPFSRAAVASLFVEQGRSERDAKNLAALTIRYMSLMVFPAALGLAALSGSLVRVLYGPAYATAASVLAVSAILGAVGPLAEPAAGLVTAAGGQRLLVRWGLVAAALTLLLDLWLVRSHCAIGGAIANGGGQIIALLGVLAIAARRFGLRPGLAFLRSVGVAAALMGAAAAVAASLLPDIATLILVPPFGALVYSALLRQLRVLSPEDGRRFNSAAKVLPPALSSVSRRAVSWLSDG